MGLAFGLLIGLPACTRPPVSDNASSAQPFSGARRDLSQDETAGGHTLRKHVGRTDAELHERLDRERDISAASTWNDRASAEAAVGAAIAGQTPESRAGSNARATPILSSTTTAPRRIPLAAPCAAANTRSSPALTPSSC